jgi:hypothetical protein
MSKHMRSQRHHPMDDATWMLEHVSMTKGATHLKLSSTSLSMLEYYSLDVVLAAAAVIIVSIVIVRSGKVTKMSNKIKFE